MIGPGRTHGIKSTYNDGCRCELCKQGYSDYRRERRGKGLDRRPVMIHGNQHDRRMDELTDLMVELGMASYG